MILIYFHRQPIKHYFVLLMLLQTKQLNTIMKATKTLSLLAIVSLSLLLFNSCKKKDLVQQRYGKLAIRLTDAPGNYQQVNIDIQTVSIHLVPDSGSGAGSKWIDLPTKSGVYNLLKLQNGIDTSIVDSVQMAAGKITQMRLILGPKNTVMVDSVMHDLKVPSGSQSGIKVKGPITVAASQTIQVKIDFDAAESVHSTGNGTYMLKPVISTL
jgi:hypothetical protein